MTQNWGLLFVQNTRLLQHIEKDLTTHRKTVVNLHNAEGKREKVALNL